MKTPSKEDRYASDFSWTSHRAQPEPLNIEHDDQSCVSRPIERDSQGEKTADEEILNVQTQTKPKSFFDMSTNLNSYYIAPVRMPGDLRNYPALGFHSSREGRSLGYDTIEEMEKQYKQKMIDDVLSSGCTSDVHRELKSFLESSSCTPRTRERRIRYKIEEAEDRWDSLNGVIIAEDSNPLNCTTDIEAEVERRKRKQMVQIQEESGTTTTL
jgi:hypothetical protein